MATYGSWDLVKQTPALRERLTPWPAGTPTTFSLATDHPPFQTSKLGAHGSLPGCLLWLTSWSLLLGSPG